MYVDRILFNPVYRAILPPLMKRIIIIVPPTMQRSPLARRFCGLVAKSRNRFDKFIYSRAYTCLLVILSRSLACFCFLFFYSFFYHTHIHAYTFSLCLSLSFVQQFIAFAIIINL